MTKFLIFLNWFLIILGYSAFILGGYMVYDAVPEMNFTGLCIFASSVVFIKLGLMLGDWLGK